ncbi:unnamed protein product [Caenorhabditis bovis]|uniref:Cleft lip and palate transmembrane protein 1 n=1 Tax=Caenorhabditis bovis TaxID=2654633 RepID=A0A8S1EPK1_9PELO|nr:unnamed protein product [Caenorhabditis bovis]
MEEPVERQNPAAQENAPIWNILQPKFFLRAFMLYSIIVSATNFLKGGKSKYDKDAIIVRNLLKPLESFDLYVYLDQSSSPITNFDDKIPVWIERSIKFSDWNGGQKGDGVYNHQITLKTPEYLQKNQSIFLHSIIVKSGQTIDPKSTNYYRNKVTYKIKQLNKYMKKYYKRTANLLTGKSEKSDEYLKKADVIKYEVLNYWHPNVSINVVDHQVEYAKEKIPMPFDEVIEFDPLFTFYRPIVYINTFWNLRDEYQPINETVKSINLSLSYYPLSSLMFQLYMSQDMKPSYAVALSDEMEEDDNDYLKRAFLETNPILLAVTAIVSVLHLIFEFLAFKNDIQFWNNKKDLVGMSVRTVLFNIFQSLIVFLYITDNDTNFVVMFSVFFGFLLECWKIPKVLDIEVEKMQKWFFVIPKVRFSDKGSYVESETKTYDDMAFRYLGWILFPLLVGYAIYSVIYVEQKGWYSWVLGVLYGYLLTFGFIMMTPQLFINYKLKSVAHLPWRMLTYKFINTFIDDLFAFVIKMPMMYRLGCFRDDIIFLIYLYQRWAYRVDKSRVNEFGVIGEPELRENEGEEVSESKKEK